MSTVTTNTGISKAEQKRQTETRNILTNQISKVLRPFQDRYLGAMVKHAIGEKERDVLRAKNRLAEDIIKFGDRNFMNRTYLENIIERTEAVLSLKNLIICDAIHEAKKEYDRKFENLISKLMTYNFSSLHLRIEKVRNAGDELEFLIVNDTHECHARFIFVEGAIQCPHYRFITTLRTKGSNSDY